MRACFLHAAPSYHGFSFFFLERLSSFFLKRRKKDAGKTLVIFYSIFRLIEILISKLTDKSKFEIEFTPNTD